MPAPLAALQFACYRSFRDPAEARLSRLTLAYGPNGAGKSALARLPALLSASRSVGSSGLNLEHPSVRGAGFRDLVWRGPLAGDSDGDLVLGVELPSGARWSWTLGWRDTRQEPMVRALRGGPVELRRPGEASDALAGPGGETFQPTWDGLLPRRGGHPGLDAQRDALDAALDGVVWIDNQRFGPERTGEPRGASGDVRAGGRGATRAVLRDPALLQAVSRWYEDHTGWAVAVQDLSEDAHRVVLAHRATGELAIPFPDGGQGLQQAFQVVVGLEHLRARGGLLVVEEPEGHLHPGLQRALAELVVDVLVARPDAGVLLETHAEVFLLAALRAAAERLAGEVRLLWVEQADDGASNVQELPLDDEGRPLGRELEGAFSVMGELRRGVIEARRARSARR